MCYMIVSAVIRLPLVKTLYLGILFSNLQVCVQTNVCFEKKKIKSITKANYHCECDQMNTVSHSLQKNFFFTL